VDLKFPKQQQKKNNNKKPRKQQMVAGKGDYKAVLGEVKTALKPVVKEALLSAGDALGGLVGSRLGSSSGGAKVGRTLAARMSKLFGMGDYTANEMPQRNSLVKPGVGSYAQFSNAAQGVRVQHREYLGDLTQGAVAGTFSSTSYPINPGLLASFPYLAPIAANFEEYRINGLVFEFVSTTSPYLAGGAMGSVVMAMEYNPAAPNYATKIQMENSDFAISARPDQNMIYGVECAVNTQAMYMIRQGNNTTLPLTATDLGNFQIAVVSPIAANTVLGEIWVSYDVELFRPKAQTAGQGWLHLTATGGGAGTFLTGTPSVQSALGALSGVTASAISGAGVFTFNLPPLPVGTVFQVIVEKRATGETAAAAPSTVTCTNTTAVNAFGNGTTLDSSSSASIYVAAAGFGFFTFRSTGNVTVTVSTFSAGVGATSQTMDCWVSVIGYGLSDGNV